MHKEVQLHPSKIYRLASFEEAAGILHGLTEEEGILIVQIDKIHIALPQELEQSLRPLIGQRMAILHTDLPDKTYLFRVLAEEPNHVERGEYGG
jgi:hypothetical protein